MENLTPHIPLQPTLSLIREESLDRGTREESPSAKEEFSARLTCRTPPDCHGDEPDSFNQEAVLRDLFQACSTRQMELGGRNLENLSAHQINILNHAIKCSSLIRNQQRSLPNITVTPTHSFKRDGSKRESIRRKLRTRKRNSSSVSSCERFEQLPREQQQIFNKLSKMDRTPGQISRVALKKWISEPTLKTSIPQHQSTPITRERLERLISRMDEDKDGNIDPEEFAKFIDPQDTVMDLEGQQFITKIERVAYAEHYRWCPPPVFILIITLFQIALFCSHSAHLVRDHSQDITWNGPAPRCSVLIYNPHRRWEAWRYLTYALVHSGYGHILLNLVIQCLMGLPLEMAETSLRVAIVYLAGVVVGSLATATFQPSTYLAGASAGVYALITAHLATLVLNWKEDTVIMRQRVRNNKIAKVSAANVWRWLRLMVVVLYVLVDIGAAVFNHIDPTINGSTVGYIAHLTGALAGLLVGLTVLKNRKTEPWEQVVRAWSCAIIVVAVGLAVCWNLAADSIYQVLFGTGNTFFPEEDKSSVWNCQFFI